VAEEEDKDSKTEPATPDKINKARQKGQIPFSREVGSVVMIFGAALAALSLGEPLAKGLIGLVRSTYSRIAIVDGSMNGVGHDLMLLVLLPLAAIMLMSSGLVLMSAFAQVGSLLTFEPLKPDIKKLNPINQFKQMFGGVKAFAEFAKSIAKVAGLGFVGYLVISGYWEVFPTLVFMSPAKGLAELASMGLVLVFALAALLAIIGAGDIFYQRWKHLEDLKMTPKEVKDEFKNREGSPEVRSKRREKAMALASQRLGAAVPSADVVVTNPTHFAVALRYQPDEDEAPIVVAKGADLLAKRIRELAREHGVSVVENRYLARILYAKVKVGGQVPRSLWKAVAEVLTRIQQIRERLNS
tara:strand:- start:2797 stop:3864 length:1068 start_codon:yes stop_codon:yes gene_type:complete